MVARKSDDFRGIKIVIIGLTVIFLLSAVLSIVFPPLSSFAVSLMLILFTIIPLVLIYTILSKVAPGLMDRLQADGNDDASTEK